MFHLVGISTQRKEELDDFIACAKKYEHTPVILGLGQKWQGFKTKIGLVHKYVSSLPRDDLVAVVDVYDLLVQSRPRDFVQLFTDRAASQGKDLVLGVGDEFGMPLTNVRKCSGIEARYFKSRFKFVNGGFVFGRAHFMTEMYDFMLRNVSHDDEVGIMRFLRQRGDNSDVHVDQTREFVCNTLHHREFTLGDDDNKEFFVLSQNKAVRPLCIHTPNVFVDLGRRNEKLRRHLVPTYRSKSSLTYFHGLARHTCKYAFTNKRHALTVFLGYEIIIFGLGLLLVLGLVLMLVLWKRKKN